MDFSLFHKVVFSLTEIAIIFCSVWVYLANKKNRTNQYFFLMNAAIFLWLFFYYNLTISSNNPSTILWPKLGYFSVALFFVFFYLFFTNLLNINRSSSDKIVIGWWAFSAIISIFTDLIVKGVVFKNNLFSDLVLGKGAVVYYGSALLMFLVILFFLFKKYYSSPSFEKIKYQYFLVGVFIWVLMNIIFNVGTTLYLDSIKYATIGNYSVIFFISFTAYAMVKHELMGVKALLTQVLVSIISIILLTDILFLSNNLAMQLLKAGILVTFLYFSSELIKTIV